LILELDSLESANTTTALTINATPIHNHNLRDLIKARASAGKAASGASIDSRPFTLALFTITGEGAMTGEGREVNTTR
jgi:hypothetical protein